MQTCNTPPAPHTCNHHTCTNCLQPLPTVFNHLQPPAQSALENPVWGVPGCTNFIDARTKWFDQAVGGWCRLPTQWMSQLLVGLTDLSV